MTIDEAIVQAREKAKEIRENIIDGNNLEPYESYCNAMTERRAEKHEQIAEWLEELKELRNITVSHLYAVAFNRGYLKAEKEVRNKAIDDFVKEFNRKTSMENKLIDEIAEQLKVGE